ncbi:MAG: HAMP domain-containing protein [Candidatus Methanofastidiosa archaeon]|nr:HAMP domain-containing protein [Candidatus Methanofastidiosa archaeon]
MRIKTKLYLGIGLLLILIILMSFFSVKQIKSLAIASENIIKDNKETIGYTQNMLRVLSKIYQDEDALNIFEAYLLKQKNNITEVGEEALTEKLSESFQKLKDNPEDKTYLADVQSFLFEIWEMNLDAIEGKSTIAAQTANKSILLIGFISFFCILISLLLFILLPWNISKPIHELTSSIKQISGNDYSQRVSFESHGEFGELAKSFNTMAQKLEEYNNSNISKLLAERKITETLLDKIQYPIIGFDMNLKITLTNKEFLKIAGLEGRSLIGENMLDVANENELIGKLIIIEPDKENKFTFDKTVSRIQVNENERDVYFEKEIQSISFNKQYEKDEQVLGYVIILKNITKFMELDLAKTHFIATVSHELKTPISAIKLSLQLLENEKTGTLNDEQRELIISCEEDTNTLLKLVSEILNLTQIETGKIQLNIMPSNLKDTIQYAINTNKPIADKRNIKFIEDYPTELPEVLIDKEKTAWVITNLISNAIRYSFDNSDIKIKILQTGNRVKISLTDSGQGIDPKYQNKIFDRYFKVPDTEKEGTGLGLAISKEFIEAQGGQISVESKIGVGSTFSIVLNCKT